MSELKERHFLGKVILRGTLKLETALHIGAQTETMEIGGIDNPVLKDPRTGKPYIPGSSLKGKLRSLWERAYYEDEKREKSWDKFFNRKIGPYVRVHVCESWETARKCPVCRLFGSSGDANKGNFPARLIVRDLHLKNEDIEIDKLLDVKYEAAIDRVTSAANPRPMERVLPGTEFVFELVYNVEDLEDLEKDISNLFKAMKLLEDDYLGGSGSRGYGKVSFKFHKAIVKTLSYYMESAKPEEIELEETTLDNAMNQILENLRGYFK